MEKKCQGTKQREHLGKAVIEQQRGGDMGGKTTITQEKKKGVIVGMRLGKNSFRQD